LTYALRAAWGGSPDSVQAADMLLSEAFVHYVADLKGTKAPRTESATAPRSRGQRPVARSIRRRNALDAPHLCRPTAGHGPGPRRAG
jgi:hypothetical protein